MLLTRSVVFISVSLTLAAGLLGSLFVIAGIDPAALLATIAGVDRLYFALIVVATFIHLYLSAEKWRLVMACTVTEKGGHMPRVAYFFYTALGALFGQVMPQQVSTAVVRGVDPEYLEIHP